MAERRAQRYMPDDVSLPGIGIGALLIIGAIALGITAAFFVLHVGTGGQAAAENAVHYGRPPPIAGNVELQPDPENDIAALRAQKRRLLSTYGWVDRANGIAHIPIGRAMDLVARGASPRGSLP